MNTWPTTLTRASRGPCRSTVQAVFGPNLANNLFASSCDKRRPGDGFFTTTMGMSMNDNDGALAVIIIGQWVTVSLLALILWRGWELGLTLASDILQFGPGGGANAIQSIETTRVHYARWCGGGCMAAPRWCAAAGDAGYWVPPDRCARCDGAHDGSLSPWAKRSRLCRGPKRRGRISLCGWSIRPTAHAGHRL